MKKITIISLFLVSFLSFSQEVPMQNGTVNNCSGVFTDSGGSMANYGDNENYTMTICGDTAGFFVQLSFTAFSLQFNQDFITIYNGPDTSSPLIGTYTGTLATSPGFVQATSANTSGCLTVVFTSNASGNGPGWTADISCYEPCQNITAEIIDSTPAADASGEISVCLGADVTFEGGAQFSVNDDTDTATYDWDFGNGQTATGQTVTTNFPDAGVYIVNLTVTDDNPLGCSSSNEINQIVRVYPEIDFTGTQAAQDVICFGDSTTIEGMASVPMFEDCAPEIIANAWLQDTQTTGQPQSYASTITVDCYGTNQVLTDVSQLLSLCINIEHSFIGDLDMYLIAPNGQEVWFLEYGDGSDPGAYFGVPDQADNGNPGTGWTYCFSPTAAQNLNQASAGGVQTIPAGDYAPLPGSSFDNILGTPLNGNWTFIVTDLWAIDDGTLFSWNLNFDPSVTPPSNSIASEAWDTDPTITNTSGNTITVQPTTSGVHCYTYRAIDDVGCEYTEEVCITVEEELFSNLTASANTVCDGEDAEFFITGTPNATITYNINGGANVVDTLDSSGNWSLIIPAPSSDQTLTLLSTTSGSGCSIAPMESLTVVVGQSYDSSFTYTATCDGGTVNLTGDSGGTFAFDPDPGDGAVIDSVTGTITNGTSQTTYTVTYGFGNSCSTPTTQSVTTFQQDDASFTIDPTCDGGVATI
ncbi:MAG TPA: PKD domain-containing protein, partial [Mangrovimonas sp.]|nr:PKD domain-containing protein [Mangrovimonas sp.]